MRRRICSAFIVMLCAAASSCALVLGLEEHQLVESEDVDTPSGETSLRDAGDAGSDAADTAPPHVAFCGELPPFNQVFCDDFDISLQLSPQYNIGTERGALTIEAAGSVSPPNALFASALNGGEAKLSRSLPPPSIPKPGDAGATSLYLTKLACFVRYRNEAASLARVPVVILAYTFATPGGVEYRIDVTDGDPLTAILIRSGNALDRAELTAIPKDTWVRVRLEIDFETSHLTLSATNTVTIDASLPPVETIKSNSLEVGIIRRADPTATQGRFDDLGCSTVLPP